MEQKIYNMICENLLLSVQQVMAQLGIYQALPLEDIYRGGNSKSRNPDMQTMLRLVGFGDNAGSGFPTILDVWKSEGWVEPQLIEDANLNQVTLVMKMERESDENVIEISEEKIKQLMLEYSRKKLAKACDILKMILKNPNISSFKCYRQNNCKIDI